MQDNRKYNHYCGSPKQRDYCQPKRQRTHAMIQTDSPKLSYSLAWQREWRTSYEIIHWWSMSIEQQKGELCTTEKRTTITRTAQKYAAKNYSLQSPDLKISIDNNQINTNAQDLRLALTEINIQVWVLNDRPGIQRAHSNQAPSQRAQNPPQIITKCDGQMRSTWQNLISHKTVQNMRLPRQ